MNPEQHRRLDSVFLQANSLLPEQHRAFVEKELGDDPELCAIALARLGNDAPLDSFATLGIDPEDAPAPAHPAKIGRYTITGKLGHGGMGEVFAARDAELDRTVALKVLPQDRARDETWIANFRQEARLLAAINHPNIATIHSFEEDGDRRFLTMEWIAGRDLLAHVEAAPLSWEEALPLARQVASALEAAHSRRIVHRDLKPKNVMVRKDGVAKVLDFGIAKTMGDDTLGDPDLDRVDIDVDAATATVPIDITPRRPAISSPGGSAGTPGYMSPEQVRGERVDACSDIWAWACTVFVMVTGNDAFGGTTVRMLLTASLTEEPQWELLPEDTPGRLRDLLEACVRKDPRQRPQSMSDVRRALDDEIEAATRRRVLEEAARTAPTIDVADVPHHIPIRLSSFVGRESELGGIETLIGNHRLVSLLGFGGCGKTSLAQEAGRCLLKHFPDGVWFAQLVNVRSEDGLAPAVLNGLRVQGSPKEDPKETLLTHLRGRKALLILDNCEQIVAEVGALATEILQVCPDVKVLTTTREILQVEGEAALAVPPMEVLSSNGSEALEKPGRSARDITAEEASRSEAVRLFCERATSANPRFGLDDSNAGSVVEICRRLDGIPLALELAAARVRALPLERLLERLENRFRILGGSRRGEVPHQQTLRATIDWSYDQLTEKEKKFLARLSVFVGGWTLEAAEAVCSDQNPDLGAEEPIEEWDVLDLLTALVDKSLVQLGSTGLERDGIEGPGGPASSRYRMLETVREYAREKLNESTERMTCEERHGEHFARLGTEEAMDALATNPTGSSEYEAELENLVAACRRAIARGDEACATASYVASCKVFDRIGPANSAIELGEEVLLACTGQMARARVLGLLGGAQQTAGRMEEARERYEAALEMHREVGNRRNEGILLDCLGILHKEQSRMDEAREHFEAALEVHREIGDRRCEGVVLGNLGTLHMEQGRMEKALERYNSALEIHREIGNRRFEGIALTNLGTIYMQQGRMEEARQQYEAAVAILREIVERRIEGIVLGNLGVLHLEQGRMEEAREQYEAALAIHREAGDRRNEGTNLGNLGALHREQGRMEEAREHYAAALAIHRDLGNRRSEGIVLAGLAHLHEDQGSMEEAREHYEAALAIHREVGDRRNEGGALGNLGRLHLELGRTEEARNHLDLADDIFREVDSPSHKGTTLVSIGVLEMEEGHTKDARSRIEAGLELLRSTSSYHGLATALCDFGELERREGNESAARAALDESESLADTLGDEVESPVRRQIAKLRTALGLGDANPAG